MATTAPDPMPSPHLMRSEVRPSGLSRLLATAVLVAASASASAVPAASDTPTAPTADASLEQLAWLTGCWASENAEPGSGEQWMAPAGASMLGMSRTVRAGKTATHEFMRIAPAADGRLAFFAQPSGKPSEVFALLSIATNEVVFENPQHDFPQRVIYRLVAPDRLHASIEGRRNGVARSIDYPMVRSACDAAAPHAAVR